MKRGWIGTGVIAAMVGGLGGCFGEVGTLGTTSTSGGGDAGSYLDDDVQGAVGSWSIAQASSLADYEYDANHQLVLAIRLSDRRIACGQARPAGTRSLVLLIGGIAGAPGTFPIASGAARAEVQTLTASCQDDGSVDAIGGSVSFLTSTSEEMSGGFALTFPGGEHLSGTFDATPCSTEFLTESSTPSCQGP